MSIETSAHAPRDAIVVGAGIVGLSTAWFLQERGINVTVVERDDVAAGSSWGNAGWVAPAYSIPLGEPGVLREGLRTVLSRKAPLYVPPRVDPQLWAFLLQFARHCTMSAWRRGMRGYAPVDQHCLEAFDTLTANGVDVPTHEAPVTAVFRDNEEAIEQVEELEHVNSAGVEVTYARLTGDEVREQVPQAGDQVTAGIQMYGQRYVDPGAFVRALGAAFESRGGKIERGFDVAGMRDESDGVRVISTSGRDARADRVVLATGTWLSDLARDAGVRTRVQAGRGYSFTVPTDEPALSPIKLPAQRVVCTPYQGQLRVAGSMEFRRADEPLDQARIRAIIESAEPLLKGMHWAERTDEWVGPRPVSTDGLPLIGATNRPGVYAAGGHGMWGYTLGPITGQLLAEEITTGKRPDALRAFSPTR